MEILEGWGANFGKAYRWASSLSIVPGACKIVKLKPVFKKGFKTDLSNCRPISLLPLLSRVFKE